jgi:RNA polymerase sigma-70 factor (ECF subfamily)
MVAILSKLFGLSNLELIEDAVQDTFLKASLSWRNQLPENPEAWLMQAAKNRVIDIFRQVDAERKRELNFSQGAIALEIDEFFLDHEVQDSQLRMLFVACHPAFSKKEQIAFALKAIAGFSMKEIAAALLQKEETIKKRLSRARQKIRDLNISLSYPTAGEIDSRMSGVLQIIYLIFNEGFHSTKENQLISKDLCGEAIRLCKLLLMKENFRSGSLYALFALTCFHASRLESKLVDNKIIDLEHQDRSKWFLPLILLGNDALKKASEYDHRSIYHIEAEIASEHVKAIHFSHTNWQQILDLYEEMYSVMPSDNVLMSKATIYLQLNELEKAKALLDKMNTGALNQRSYLLHGCYADYYSRAGNSALAIVKLDKAIQLCSNAFEKQYLENKREALTNKL